MWQTLWQKAVKALTSESTTLPKDIITELKDFPQMSTGAPIPQISKANGALVLIYRCFEEDDGVERCAKVTFERAWWYQMGWPNDEVLHAHPLYRNGLKFYAVQEVSPSLQIARLKAGNSRHHKHHDGFFADSRHLIFTFKDETLEVVCEGYTIERIEGDPYGLSKNVTRL